MSVSSTAISVEGLTRLFGKRPAVDDISFRVTAGDVFGFLGPNGAGKTTTISMLTTLLRPSSGTARVAGHDISADPASVRRSIGVVFQEPTLDDRLTATENLVFHAALYGMGRRTRTDMIGDSLRLVGLGTRANELVERFSGGMRRRLEIARGLLHRPTVLFFDEPTLGLDPQTRRALWEHIRTLPEETGVTVFMTTHYLEEAESCDRIAIIDHGRIVALDTPAGLKSQVGGDVVTVGTPDVRGLADFLAGWGLDPVRYRDRIHVEVIDGDRFIPRLIREYSGRIEAATLRRPTLDDVFLRLTGRSIRDEEPDPAEIARRSTHRHMALRGRR